MAASATDKARKSYSLLQKTLGATINNSDTTISLNNYTNIPTDTAVDFIIDRIDSNGNRTNTTRELCKGVCTGSAITNVTRGLHGTTAQSHNSGAVVEFVASGAAWNDLIDLVLTHANQDGTLKAGAVDAAAVLASGVVTEPKLADNSVDSRAYVDGSIDPEHLVTGAGTSWAWQTWTPSWTNLSVGNGTVTAKYCQIGKTIIYDLKLVWGSTTSISGSVSVSIPVTADSRYGSTSYFSVATGSANDGGGAVYPLGHFLTSTTGGSVFTLDVNAIHASVTNLVPFTWTTGDILMLSGRYEAA